MVHHARRPLPGAVAAFLISAVATPSAQRGAGPAGGIQGAGRGRRAGPAQPAPRSASGRALRGGANSLDKGVWLPVFAVGARVAPLDQTPFQPWARALYDDRLAHALEPHTRCKASGVARQFETRYGAEMPEIPRISMFDAGGPHTCCQEANYQAELPGGMGGQYQGAPPPTPVLP